MKRFETTWFFRQIEPFVTDILSFVTDKRMKTLMCCWCAAFVLIVGILTFVKDIYNLVQGIFSTYSSQFRYTKLGIDILEKTLATWLIWYSIKLVFHYYSPQNKLVKKLGYSASSLLICLPILFSKAIFRVSLDIGVATTEYLTFSLISFFFGMVLPVIANNRHQNYFLDRA